MSNREHDLGPVLDNSVPKTEEKLIFPSKPHTELNFITERIIGCRGKTAGKIARCLEPIHISPQFNGAVKVGAQTIVRTIIQLAENPNLNDVPQFIGTLIKSDLLKDAIKTGMATTQINGPKEKLDDTIDFIPRDALGQLALSIQTLQSLRAVKSIAVPNKRDIPALTYRPAHNLNSVCQTLNAQFSEQSPFLFFYQPANTINKQDKREIIVAIYVDTKNNRVLVGGKGPLRDFSNFINDQDHKTHRKELLDALTTTLRDLARNETVSQNLRGLCTGVITSHETAKPRLIKNG